MAIDITARGSDGWWLNRLAYKLGERAKRAEKLDAYFRGDPPLPQGAESMREAYKQFQKKSRTNFAELVAEAPRERMQIVGFRTALDDGEAGDQAVWQQWRGAGLPVESADVHQMMLALADGYVIVGWADGVEGAAGRPIVTAEDPRQVVTMHDPQEQRRVIAALKMFHDDETDRDLAYLYLPGRVRVAVRERKARSNAVNLIKFSPSSWSWSDEVDPEGSVLGGVLPAQMKDVVPVVRFRNRRGVGEFEPHLDVLERINHTLLQRMVIAAFQAFRQRAIKGLTAEDTEDEDGNELDLEALFTADPGALWKLPANVEMWESAQVDMGPILNSIKDDVLHLSAVTRTPLHMTTPDGAAQSAEGASLQREGLVFKTEDRIARASEGWAAVVSYMFRWAGDAERAKIEMIVPLWAPVERYSLAEKASAWAQTTDLPFATKARQIWQANPDELARMQTERADDLLAAQVAAQQAARQPVPTPTPPPRNA